MLSPAGSSEEGKGVRRAGIVVYRSARNVCRSHGGRICARRGGTWGETRAGFVASDGSHKTHSASEFARILTTARGGVLRAGRSLRRLQPMRSRRRARQQWMIRRHCNPLFGKARPHERRLSHGRL